MCIHSLSLLGGPPYFFKKLSCYIKIHLEMVKHKELIMCERIADPTPSLITTISSLPYIFADVFQKKIILGIESTKMKPLAHINIQ